MRILMLTDYFYPHVGGGVEKVVLDLSLYLVSHGHDVCVLTLNTTHAKKIETFQGIKIIRSEAIELTRLTGLQSAISLSVWSEAREIMQDFEPDIIHVHNLFFFTTLVGVLLKKQFHIPLITTLHLGSVNYISGIKGWIVKLIEKFVGRWILTNSDLVTSVSNNVKEHGIKMGLKSEKCIVIPNGVDLSFFRMNRTYSTKPRTIIFIGRLLFNKGPHILLESVKFVLEKISDIHINIVGDGPLKTKLEEFTKKNNLSKNVTFLGRIDDIRNAMKESDVYVRPSFLDGMPLGVLESMAAGLPVIATEIAGTPEIIIHAKTGHLVKPGNVRDIANAIVYLLTNPEYTSNLAKNALEYVKSNHDWNDISKKYEECYVSMLKKHSKFIK